MGLFGSSKSDDASSSAASTSTLPTRSSRQECWVSRDSYYECLQSKKIIVPPGTDTTDPRAAASRRSMTREEQASQAEKERKLSEARDSDPCKKLRGDYEGHCAKSWVEYFNKRRVLEERQRLTMAQGQPLPGTASAQRIK